MRRSLLAAAAGATAAILVNRRREPALSERDAAAEVGSGLGGPPGGVPYTVYFPDGDGLRPVDLDHPAPLPRVGDVMEYLDAAGGCHRFEVAEVIHTVQAAFLGRPAVDERGFSPTALAEATDAPPLPDPDVGLTAGLPKVILRRPG